MREFDLGGYHCHQSSYSVGLRLQHAGGADWSVDIGGFTGTSTAAQTNATELEGGTEATEQSVTTCGSLKSLGYNNGQNQGRPGWNDASYGNGYLSAANPPSLYWVSEPNSLRSYRQPIVLTTREDLSR